MARVKGQQKKAKETAKTKSGRGWTPKVIRPRNKRVPGRITAEELERQAAAKSSKAAREALNPEGRSARAGPDGFSNLKEVELLDLTFRAPDRVVLELCISGMFPEEARALAIRKRPISFAAVKWLKDELGWDPATHQNLSDICPSELWLGLIDRALARGRQIILPEMENFYAEYKKYRQNVMAAGKIVEALVDEGTVGKLIALRNRVPRHVAAVPEVHAGAVPAGMEAVATAAANEDDATQLPAETCSIGGCDGQVAECGYQVVVRDGVESVAGICEKHLAKVLRANPARLFLRKEEAEKRVASQMRDDEDLAIFMASIVPE